MTLVRTNTMNSAILSLDLIYDQLLALDFDA
jgi:hypothetical protein